MSKRVLVTPLDWGLGHATRCIPIIRELLELDCEVLLAGSGQSLHLLQLEFPLLRSFEIVGYTPRYSTSSMIISMLGQLPRFIQVIRKEHEQIRRLVQNNRIDLVIADNRYGAWVQDLPSIFITHQLNIIMPKGLGLLSPLVNYFNHRQVKKFTACWVPDSPDSKLSGELSSPVPSLTSIDNIGPLSRFEKKPMPTKYDVAVILSGPEPQRSIFEKIVMEQLIKTSLSAIVVRGIVNSNKTERINRIEVVGHLKSNQLNEVINQSDLIIARSGYSTIMDLAKLEKKAVLVPTPGQTEQEYLANYVREKRMALCYEQSDFKLTEAIHDARLFTGFLSTPLSNRLKEALKDILSHDYKTVY